MIAPCDHAQGYALTANSSKARSRNAARGKPAGAPPAAARAGHNEVRIIGGLWRARRIRFEANAQLRPTPNRVRETLFNWLREVIVGARCLDLFAGSGALGLEALSRGAATVTFVESDPKVAASLARSLAALAGPDERRAAIVTADAYRYLGGPAVACDVVFLDPPFAAGRLAELCTLLQERGWLAPRADIYLESAARAPAPSLPATWQVRRQMRAGEVSGLLARRDSVGTAAAPAAARTGRVDET
jgi:16S rRNA (guanine966-N2)-methyltransferase